MYIIEKTCFSEYKIFAPLGMYNVTTLNISGNSFRIRLEEMIFYDNMVIYQKKLRCDAA